MSNKVFQLIHKLSPTEKRHYLKYSLSNSKEGKKSQHLIVFQTITKYNIQDNKQLQIYIKKEKWFRNLARIKNYIYEDLIDFLVYHHRKHLDERTGYFSLLRNRVLEEKGFLELAHDNNKKSALRAEKGSRHLFAALIFELVHSLHTRNALFTPALFQESLAICEKIHLNLRYVKERYDYTQINLKIMQIKRNANLSFSDKKDILIEMLNNNPQLQYFIRLEHPLNYLSYSDSLFRISDFLNDLTKTVQTLESSYQIVAQSNLAESTKQIHLYQICLKLCDLYTTLRDKSSFVKVMKLAKLHLENLTITISKNHLLRMDYMIHSKHITFYSFNGEYQLGVNMTPEITNFLKANDDKLNDSEKIHLYFRLTVCHWGLNDYKKVTTILESYLNFNKLPNHAEEYIALRLLYCIAQIDLGNYSLAKSQCRKLIYDKQKQPSWHELKTYKEFINKLYYLASILTEKKASKLVRIKFREIHHTISALSNDNQYKTLFQSWVQKQVKKY